MERIKRIKMGQQIFEGVKNYTLRSDLTLIIEPSFHPTKHFMEEAKQKEYEEILVQIEETETWKSIRGPFCLREHLGLLIFSRTA